MKDGDLICIASSQPFLSITSKSLYNDYDVDWLAALGTKANGAFCVSVSRTGSTYTLNGTYYIADKYDFNINEDFAFPGLPTNESMAKLHVAGLARAFYVHGEKDITDYSFYSNYT